MRKVAAFAVVATILLAGMWLYVKHTPQYSLYKFSHALQQHDADTAFQYIDVDAVVDNHFRRVAQELDAKQATSSNPWQQMGNSLAKGFINLMLPTLKENARSEIRAAIEEPTKPGDKGTFNVLAGAASWRDFKVEKQGKIAMVTKETDKEFAIKLSQAQDGHWKIVQYKSKDFKPSFPH